MLRNDMKTLFGILLCAALAALFLVSGCRKLTGEFGFKAPFDDAYRKAAKIPEIKSDERKDWVFVFNEFSGIRDIGIFIMKKELVWAEVTHFMKKINKENNTVYGSIADLQEGRYKIVLVEKNNLIAEQEFLVYSDEESQ